MARLEENRSSFLTDEPYLESILGIRDLFPKEGEPSNMSTLNTLDGGFNGAYKLEKGGLSAVLDIVDQLDERPETIRTKEPVQKDCLLTYFEVEFIHFDSAAS